MENPQLEDGYTRIANKLMEAIFKTSFNGSQFRVLFCLIRNTYGYGRKECDFSNGYVARATGIDKKNVAAVVKSLEDGNVLITTQKATFGTPRKVTINKDFEKWTVIQPLWVKSQPVGDVATTPGGDITTTPGGDVTTQKRKNIKKDIKKDNNIVQIEELFERLWSLYPRKRGKNAVSKKAKQVLFAAGYEKVANAIAAYIEECNGKEEQYILNGSTFFNGRWEDYADSVRTVEEETRRPASDYYMRFLSGGDNSTN